jgi:hypothetical protein
MEKTSRYERTVVNTLKKQLQVSEEKVPAAWGVGHITNKHSV